MKNTQIKLYHATNENSFLLMKKAGFIGLNQEDYRKLSLEISKILNCDENIFHSLIDKDSGESSGGVSFFPNLSSCYQIVKIYAKSGGEWRGSFIKSSFKRYARKYKIPYQSLSEKMSFLIGSASRPVILEFNIPESYIVNKKSIGTNQEHYTNEKISLEYLTNIHYIDK